MIICNNWMLISGEQVISVWQPVAFNLEGDEEKREGNHELTLTRARKPEQKQTSAEGSSKNYTFQHSDGENSCPILSNLMATVSSNAGLSKPIILLYSFYSFSLCENCFDCFLLCLQIDFIPNSSRKPLEGSELGNSVSSAVYSSYQFCLWNIVSTIHHYCNWGASCSTT